MTKTAGELNEIRVRKEDPSANITLCLDDLYELVRLAYEVRDKTISWGIGNAIYRPPLCCEDASIKMAKTLQNLSDFLDEHPEFRRMAALQAKDTENGTESPEGEAP